MEMQRNITAIGDRLSDLPDSILLLILSKLPDSKQVVRTSLLSSKWHYLWKSVPVSLEIQLSGRRENRCLASTDKDLYYWRYFEKLSTFRVILFGYLKKLLKDVDLCVHFAINDANVECFTLAFYNFEESEEYTFPQFAYKNTLLRNLVLSRCQLNPFGTVNWSNLISLSLEDVKLTHGSMKKILAGCPNLECLELKTFYGINCLEINNVKLREVTIEGYRGNKNGPWLEIFAPHIQKLQLLGYCDEIRIRQRNVASLVTIVIKAVFFLDIDHDDEEYTLEDFYNEEQQSLEKECGYLKELLHGVAHVENLELGTWCIQHLSILEWKGWQSPPSGRKFLKLSASFESVDFLGICSVLQSSLDLEKLVINWYGTGDLVARFVDEDEQSRRFETHNFDCSLRHLKTIKIIYFRGAPSENKYILPLKKHLLKIATVLEKFTIVVRLGGNGLCQNFVKMKQEFLSFPRSSLHVSVVFSHV